MKSVEQMKLEAKKYLLSIDDSAGEVYLVKKSGYVQISAKRAIDWVNAGIDDLDCRSTERLLEILNKIIKEGKSE